jgi:IS1 family transposase
MSNARNLANLLGTGTQITTADIADGAFEANKNLIINGAQLINQRGDATGRSGTGYYGPDRFETVLSTAGTWSVSQSSTAPDGFRRSFKFDCTTADASLSTSDYLVLYYTFEGQDLQRLKKGTSSAEKSTLSFWIRSNKTGTYQVNMQDQENSRLTGKTYTIDAANTWERKVITFDGDTTGAYTNGANASLNLEWWFAAGSTFTGGAVPTSWEAFAQADRAAGLNVNLADSTSNELYITGVQLEVGDTATPFEHRSYADELARCQRYYQVGRTYVSTYRTYAGNWAEFWPIIFSTVMRDNPTMSKVTVHTSSNLNGHDPYYPNTYGFSHFCYIAANGQYTSDFTWDADAEL